MPPKINKGRQCDKVYFWNVVNSICKDELDAILQHANEQRNQVDGSELHKEAITVSNEMANLLKQHPWMSVSRIVVVN